MTASDCLTVGKITRKVSKGFCWKSNFHQMLILGPETDDYTMVMFWNLVLLLPMLFYTMGVSHIMWENDLLVEVCTPVVLLHIFSFKLNSEICQVLALINSVEWHQAEGKRTKVSSSFTVFCQTSLVLSQQRVTVYDNAHTHSALRTELNYLSVSVSIFTNDVNNQNIAEVPERRSCCLLFVEATLTKFWFCVSLLPFHMYCTCHGEQKQSQSRCSVPLLLSQCHYPHFWIMNKDKSSLWPRGHYL